MKLHLPKALLSAIAAALVTPAAYAYTLQTGDDNHLTTDQYIDNTQSLEGDVTVDGQGETAPDGHTLTLQSGADVDITGNLFIVSQCHLAIEDNASLTTSEKLSIGDNSGGNPAHLLMTGGELTVSGIRFNGDNANTASITGGTLAITGEAAITQTGGHNNSSNLTIGGTGDTYVTLKTGIANDVTFDYGGLQLGNVTIASDNAQTITITNATLNGTLNNQATADKLILSGNNTLGRDIVAITESYYSDGTTPSTSANGYLHTAYTANIGDNLTVADGATLTFGAITLAYDSTTGICTNTYTDMSTYYVGEKTMYNSNLTTAPNICVKTGATLDANGVPIEFKTIILQEGSTFANTGGGIGTNLKQNSHITLEGNANLYAASSMGIIGSGFATSYLELNGHTLDKKGAGTVTMINTDITAGKVDIQEGTVVLQQKNRGNVTVHGTVFNIAEGSQLTFDNFGSTGAGDVILNATGTGTINVRTNTTISGNAGDRASTSTFAGTVNVTGGLLSIGSSESGDNGGWRVQAENMGIKLNGGNLYYFGHDSTLGNLKVAQNATYTIHDTKSNNTVSHKALSIAENATLRIVANWAGCVSFEKLTGDGDLSLERSTNASHTSPILDVTIATVDFNGNITQTAQSTLTVTTIAKAGNITNNGGTMSLGNITSAGNIANNSGTMSLGNITSAGSIANDGTLWIGTDASSTAYLGSTITNTGTLNLNGTLEATSSGNYESVSNSAIGYTEGDNGFKVIAGGEYYLVKGGTITLEDTATFKYDGTVKTLVSTTEGVTFSIDETTSSEFYVNSGLVSESALKADSKVEDSTVYILNGGTLQADGDISNSRLSYTSGSLEVTQGHSLTIDTAKDDAARLLLNTTGDGNVTLLSDITMNSGQSTAAKSTTLTVGGGTGDLVTFTVEKGSIESFSSVRLENGKITYSGTGGGIKGLSVTEHGGELYVEDMDSADPQVVRLTGTTSVSGTLTLNTLRKSTVNIERLAGSGDIVFNGATLNDNSATTLILGTLGDFEGSITVNKKIGDSDGTSKAILRLTHTNASGETFHALTLGSVVQGNNTLGGIVEIFNSVSARTTTVKSLTINGLGTIETKRDPNCWNGTINIESLRGTNAVLNLRSGSQTPSRTVFTLGTADAVQSLAAEESTYTGTINVVANANTGNSRRVGLVINNDEIAQDSIINLAETTANSSGNYADLGVNSNNVNVRGITTTARSADHFTATIVSGELGANTTGAKSDNNVRTLTINTKSGDNFTANAAIKGNLNLVKMGEGKQTFSGDMSAFDKAVSVEGGELTFSNAVVLEITDLTVKRGATLTIGSPVQPFAVNAALVTEVNATGTVRLEGGSTLNTDLNLTSTQTLEINDIGNDPITLNGALVLPTGENITLTGNILTTLAWLGKDRKLEVFTGVTSLTLGDTDYTGVMEASKATDLKNFFTFTGLEAGSYSLGYTGAEGGGVVYIQKNVPEPTTATLSLLALAALAARRRRKD